MSKGLPAERVHFVSDLHFGHRNVIEFCRRPFKSLEHMHEGLIAAWNERVALTDYVFVLGDFCLGKTSRAFEVAQQLNGQKLLIKGNHDRFASSWNFEWEKDLYTVKVYDPDAPHADSKGCQRIVLCHFPMMIWDRRHHGAWHLHGHSHGTLAEQPGSLMLDVGVDATAARGWGYRPLAYVEVKALMKSKPCWPVSYPTDHHSPKTGE